MRKLIREIKKYVKGINDTERNKLGELSNGKFLVASTVLKIIKDHKSQPPNVRPMSELPEGRTFDFIALIIRKDNGFKFHECMERNDYLVQGSHEDFAFFKSENYENEEFKILGWLQELPNPNDIKL